MLCQSRVAVPSNANAGLHRPREPFGALAARLREPPGRLRLADLPTPVERAPWLDRGHARVFLKRDDASSTLYGGGKVRKLEWVLANPPYDTDDPIVSIGGIGSHHLLALALFLPTLGRSLHALTFETEATPHVRQNLAVLLSSGVRLWHVRTRAHLPWAFASYYAFDRPERIGRYLAAGASTALGCFGFVEAAFELAGQIEAGLLPTPDAIYVTAGSAGTAAGLVLGLGLAGVGTHLHLVSSVERWAFNRFLFERKLAEAYRLLLRMGYAGPRDVKTLLARARVGFEIDDRELGRGYGAPTEAAEHAVRRAAEHGLRLETTYTAKCLSALLRDGDRSRRTILFWNTHAGNDLTRHIVPGWELRSPIPVPTPKPE